MAQQVGNLFDRSLLANQVSRQAVTQQVGTGSCRPQIALRQAALDDGGDDTAATSDILISAREGGWY
jgi:hypothetical protein